MVAPADSGTIKFLCSYNGIIAPRPADGLLRYYGGLTRVLAVHRHISYAELMVKLVEFCGFSVDLKCALPQGDLETLVTIKSEEELANLIQEYDGASTAPSKIRAVLTPPKRISPRNSSDVGSSSSSSSSSYNYRIGSRSRVVWQRNGDIDDEYCPPPLPPPQCSVVDDFYCPKSCWKYYSSATTRSSPSSCCQQCCSPDWRRISSTTGNYYYYYYYYNPKAVDRLSCCRIPMRRSLRSAAPRVS